MDGLTISGDVRRVIVVVLDGLRPDAITSYGLPNVLRLARNGASTFDARTVAPSVTAVAMASLLTGAAPDRHRVLGDRFHLPRPSAPIHPLARVLAQRQVASSAFMAHVPWLMRPIAGRIAKALGFGTVRFRGAGAIGVLATARRQILDQRRGLIVMHWPDADRAGHDHGWMSPQYADAARDLDTALGGLLRIVDLDNSGTLLVALADHGGGGRAFRHHDSDHALDRTIPIVFSGGGVRAGTLRPGVSLIDVPPTILSVLGVPVPDSYAGTSLAPMRRAPVAPEPALEAA